MSHLDAPPSTTSVEHKVTASTFGAGAGLTIAAFINWALAEYVFHGDVPEPVQAFVLLAVTSGGAFLLGYSAPHTARPARPAPPTTEA